MTQPANIIAQNLLRSIELNLIACLSDETILPALLASWQSVISQIHVERTHGRLDATTIQSIQHTAARMEIVISHVINFSSSSSEIEDGAIVKMQHHLAGPSTQLAPSTSSSAHSAPMVNSSSLASPLVSFARYRQFFLSHLAHPYPTPAEQISLRIPTHSSQQLLNWFVNARRRSGWQAVYKELGGGTKAGMRRVMDQYEGINGSDSGEEKKRIDEVINYLTEGGRDSIASVLAGVMGESSGAQVGSTMTTTAGSSSTWTPKRSKKRRRAIRRATTDSDDSEYDTRMEDTPSMAAVASRGSTIARHSLRQPTSTRFRSIAPSLSSDSSTGNRYNTYVPPIPAARSGSTPLTTIAIGQPLLASPTLLRDQARTGSSNLALLLNPASIDDDEGLYRPSQD